MTKKKEDLEARIEELEAEVDELDGMIYLLAAKKAELEKTDKSNLGVSGKAEIDAQLNLIDELLGT